MALLTEFLECLARSTRDLPVALRSHANQHRQDFGKVPPQSHHTNGTLFIGDGVIGCDSQRLLNPQFRVAVSIPNPDEGTYGTQSKPQKPQAELFHAMDTQALVANLNVLPDFLETIP